MQTQQERFDEYLNLMDCSSYVRGIEFSAAHILKACDPTAYAVAFSEWEKENPTELPCHVCGVLIDKDELDENGAYSYPDNLPHCPEHYDEEPGT